MRKLCIEMLFKMFFPYFKNLYFWFLTTKSLFLGSPSSSCTDLNRLCESIFLKLSLSFFIFSSSFSFCFVCFFHFFFHHTIHFLVFLNCRSRMFFLKALLFSHRSFVSWEGESLLCFSCTISYFYLSHLHHQQICSSIPQHFD